MSTRSTTWFMYDKTRKPTAIVYRHADGYPEGHGKELQEFFSDVEAQTKDTRYNDPSYLSAKLIVWLARRFATTHEWIEGEYQRIDHANERPLDFISVGVVSEDPDDIEYRYLVDCNTTDENGRPAVICIEIGWGDVPDHEVEIPA